MFFIGETKTPKNILIKNYLYSLVYRLTGKRKYATAKPSKVQIQQEGYYVVKTDDLSLVTFDQLANYDQSWPDNEGNLTRVKADELMDIYMQENPDKQVQVISAYEYEEAA